MYRGAIDSAVKQFFIGNDPMAIIQEQAGKYLVGIVAQPCHQVAPGGSRVSQGVTPDPTIRPGDGGLIQGWLVAGHI